MYPGKSDTQQNKCVHPELVGLKLTIDLKIWQFNKKTVLLDFKNTVLECHT